MEETLPIHLKYNSELGLLICATCHCGLRSQGAIKHLKGKNHGLSKTEAAQKLLPFQEHLVKPDRPFPTTLEQRIDDLQLWPEARRCNLVGDQCRYICTSKYDMTSHQKHTHKTEWQSAGIEAGHAYRVVVAQRLFRSGPASELREITGSIAGLSPSSKAISDPMNKSLRLNLTERIVADHAEKRRLRRIAIEEEDGTHLDPWLSRTGWRKYLHGHNRATLTAMIHPPDLALDDMEYITYHAVHTMIQKAQDTTMAAGHFIRKSINSFYDETISPMGSERGPITSYEDHATLADSARHWQKIVLFWIRDWTVFGRDSIQQFSLTEDQQACLDHVLDTQHLANAEEQVQIDSDVLDCPPIVPDFPVLSSHEAAILSFIISLLKGRQTHNDYEHALIATFAVLNLGTESGWQTCSATISMISAMMKTARFMIVQQCQQEGLHEGRGNDGKITWNQKHVIALRNETIYADQPTPLIWLNDLRAYGMTILKQQIKLSPVNWCHNGTTLLYKELEFSMSSLRSFVSHLTRETAALLDYEVLLSKDDPRCVPKITLAEIRDNPSIVTDGWSFLKHPNNKWHIDGERWLAKRVHSNPSLSARFIDAKIRDYSKERCTSYLHCTYEFLRKLFVLIHITSGQPASLPELLKYSHRNPVGQENRSLYINDGLVALVSRYDKTFRRMGRANTIWRFLPAEVSEILIKYLWLGLPWIEQLKCHFGCADDLSDDIWPNSPQFSNMKMRKAFEAECSRYLKVSIDIPDWRYIAVGISEKYLDDAMAFEEVDDDLAFTVQAGHSPEIESPICSKDQTTDLLDILATETRMRATSVLWHELLGCSAKQSSQNLYERQPGDQKIGYEIAARKQHLRAAYSGTSLGTTCTEPEAFRSGQKLSSSLSLPTTEPTVGTLNSSQKSTKRPRLHVEQHDQVR